LRKNANGWVAVLLIGFIASFGANSFQVYIAWPLYKKYFEKKITIKGEITDSQLRIVNATVRLYSGSEISMVNTEKGLFKFKDIPEENSYLIRVTRGLPVPGKERWYPTPIPQDSSIDFKLKDFPSDLCTIRGYISSSSPYKSIPRSLQIWAGDIEGNLNLDPSKGSSGNYIIMSIPPPTVNLRLQSENRTLTEENVPVCTHEPKNKTIIF